MEDDSTPEDENVTPPNEASGAGRVPPQPSLFQQYFPSWYSSAAAAEIRPEVSMSPSLDSLNVSSLEEELMEGLADDFQLVPYKDVVFAQVNFVLRHGCFRLFSKKTKTSTDNHSPLKGGLLFELMFSDMKAGFESRPRTKSYMASLSLSSMLLRDAITPDSMFPMLISPQNVQGAPLYPPHKGKMVP